MINCETTEIEIEIEEFQILFQYQMKQLR